MEAQIELESDDSDRKRRRREDKSRLKDRFTIAHKTLELEVPSDKDVCSNTGLYPDNA
ncbi:hypothetical protein [Pelagicoccus sp. SDUM812002]|uniref:hypothetical protein n=1 Tax=Pelagicoccus sp. SDUM812002 TaxID=3041266 RepID=UPI00280CE285|nr:hypothetical protein [Pelagicoccus sp. SDUM812002]MDQ8184130.1 hypothetical protein [Pelagicoccus sp. SDUM812002]